MYHALRHRSKILKTPCKPICHSLANADFAQVHFLHLCAILQMDALEAELSGRRTCRNAQAQMRTREDRGFLTFIWCEYWYPRKWTACCASLPTAQASNADCLSSRVRAVSLITKLESFITTGLGSPLICNVPSICTSSRHARMPWEPSAGTFIKFTMTPLLKEF